MKYRKYKAGDTIRITGEQGKLFNSQRTLELENGVELGVECVLVKGLDAEGDVKLSSGILANGNIYISARCIELVQAVEDKTLADIEHEIINPGYHLLKVRDPKSRQLVAHICYGLNHLPKEVAKAFAESIKATYDSIINNSKNIMENKTISDEFESKFGDFERQFAEMRDAHPDKIREFITTIILASAHDNSLVDAAFKWVENKNNKPDKALEDYIKLLVKILQEDTKEGKLIIEKQEIDTGKNEVVANLLFTPNSCTKKIKVTFDYNELTKKIHCSRSEVTTK